MAEEVASEKALTIIAKIKAKQWKAMGKTVEQMKEFTETGGMGDFVGDLKDTISLQVQDALSPLKNEINEAVMEALAPIMPQIVQFLSDVTDAIVLGIEALEALITGKWDEFIKEQTVKFQKDVIENLEGGLKEMHTQVQKFWHMVEKGKGLEAIQLGAEGFVSDVRKGIYGFGKDIARGWEGFWSDLGWK